MSKNRLRRVVLVRVLAVLGVLLTLGAPVQTSAISAAQVKAYSLGLDRYDTEVGSAACSSYALVGGDNAEKTWNFFKAKGLDDIHVAAIMGSIAQESSFIPERIEGGHGLPYTSSDPTASGPWGWGLVQWTPGSRVIALAKGYGLTTPVSDLGTQLEIIWREMGDIAPPGNPNILPGFVAISDLPGAVSYFTTKFEAAGVIGPRLSFAQSAMQRYGGSTTGSTTTSSTLNTTNGCASAPSNCPSATGVAKIICAAKAYDSVSYSETGAAGHQGGVAWHKTCPTVGPSCILDCSGLVNIAVYDAFGTDLRQNTYAEANDSKDWTSVSFDKLQPGDLIQPNPGHVEIIDSISGSTLHTFGAHTSSVPQPDQVGPTTYQNSSSYVYLHYIGPGL